MGAVNLKLYEPLEDGVSYVVGEIGKKVTARTVLSGLGRLVTRFNPYLFAGMMAYDIGSTAYDYFTDDNKKKTVPLSNSNSDGDGSAVIVDNHTTNLSVTYDDLSSVLSSSKNKYLETKKEETEKIYTDLHSFSGVTLPEIMTNNTSAIVKSVNALTESINVNVGNVSNGIAGINFLFNEFLNKLDLNNEINHAVQYGRLENEYDNKRLQSDLISVLQNMNLKDKMDLLTTAVGEVDNSVNIAESGSTTNVNMLPDELISKISSVLDVQKPALETQKLKDELQKEHYEYHKTPKSITNLDGDIMATLSPREVKDIKNVSDARWQTDSNEFELEDDDMEVNDIMGALNLDGMFEFNGQAEAMKEVFENFKQGLGQ